MTYGMDFLPALKKIDVSSTAVTIADVEQDDTPLIYTNDAFRTLTGYEDDEILGRNCRFLQGPGTDKETVTQIRIAIKRRLNLFRCILNYKKGGEPFYNLLAISPLNISEKFTLVLGCQCEIHKDIGLERVRSHYFSVGRIEGSLQGISQKTDDLILSSAKSRIEAIKLMIDNYFLIIRSKQIQKMDGPALSRGDEASIDL